MEDGEDIDFDINANTGASYNHCSNSNTTFWSPQLIKMKDGEDVKFGNKVNVRGLYNCCSNSNTSFQLFQQTQIEKKKQMQIQNISISFNKIGFIEVVHINALNLFSTYKKFIQLTAISYVRINKTNIIWI